MSKSNDVKNLFRHLQTSVANSTVYLRTRVQIQPNEAVPRGINNISEKGPDRR
ncbi:hypothetical protein COLO4_30208 [Corchorus olitorius]|uniref:Uncharacterized protein n=1 Tax=Corchorus olitorius TaxID=93759 RepID=A0A1R3HA12_9ROSI|nr:hypothetical protein COLO4_30208 [Corchorus olitorius]